MDLEYSLSRADYISFQLFAATKSEMIRKKKRKVRITLPIIYLILGTILLTIEDQHFVIIYFVIILYLIGILWYFLYPTLTKNRSTKHYKKYVDENFKNRFDTLIKVKISSDNELVETIDFQGESKFKASEIEKIFEIKRFIYIKMKSGSYFIIPKYKIQDIDKLKEELNVLSKTKNFEIETDLEIDFVDG